MTKLITKNTYKTLLSIHFFNLFVKSFYSDVSKMFFFYSCQNTVIHILIFC